MGYIVCGCQVVDFDQQLSNARTVVFQDTAAADWETMLFLRANGKPQISLANCKNWKAEAPQALVCWVCGRNKAKCIVHFGLENTIDGWWEIVLPIGAIYRHILGNRRIPDYGLHGVLRVTICGISGMRDAVLATTGKSAAVVVHNFFSTYSRCCLHGSEDGNKG